jgi:hydroxymethylbilane synthase
VIRVGTRASALALAQAGTVADGLRALGERVEIVPMRTEGDRLLAAPLADVGGKGLFVRELEEALSDRVIDIAVHSLKDLPAELPGGLALVAFPAREDPRDVLVSRGEGGLGALAAGAVVGTSSPRRRALLLAARSDLVVEPIRGNVDTRLRKLAERGFDAVILAAAGLKRLGLVPRHAVPLPPEMFVPAVGQGILGVEARADDARVARLLAALDHRPTRACARAERAYLARLGASCKTPMAGHASIDGDVLRMTAVVVSTDGRALLRAAASARPDDAEATGRALAERLLERGAAAVTALQPRT